MLDYLAQLDANIFLFFNGYHNGYFDNFMSMFSGRFIWIPMYAGLLYMMLRRYQPVKVIVMLVGIALSITLADQICATFIRPIFERLRPSNLQNPLSEFTHIVNNYRGGAYGFPSCHAANSFALAAFAACMIARRPFTLFILSWAVLNSYSRIYLGVHYPGDLIVGGLIGATVGFFCYRLAGYVLKHISPKYKMATASQPLLANCQICNSLDAMFASFPKGVRSLGAMGFVAFLTTLYILLSSIQV